MKKVIIALLVVASLFAFVSCKEAEPETIDFTLGVGIYTHNPDHPVKFVFTKELTPVDGVYTLKYTDWETLSSCETAPAIGGTEPCFAIVADYDGDASKDVRYTWTITDKTANTITKASDDPATGIAVLDCAWYGNRTIEGKNIYQPGHTYVVNFQIEKEKGAFENYTFKIAVEAAPAE